MKYVVITFLSLFFVSKIYGQSDTVIFNKFDSTFFKGTITNGQRTGSWFKFNKNNEVMETVTYKKNNKATVRTYNYDNGRLKEMYDCDIMVNEDYKLILNGKYESYDDVGKIQRKGNFLDGLGDGLWIIYNDNGDTISSIYYNQGKLSGKWIEYYYGQKIKSEGLFKDDLKIGLWKEYHLNGKIKAEGEYFPSKRDIHYSKAVFDSLKKKSINIQMISFPIEVFAKDKKWAYNSEQGKIIKEEIWDKGILLEAKEYDEYGKLKSR